MRSRTILLGSATALCLTVAPAFANDIYLTVFGGANWANDVKAVSGGGGTVTSTRTTSIGNPTAFGAFFSFSVTFFYNAVTAFNMSGAKAETGWVIGAAVGKDLDSIFPGLRGEVELSFRHNNLHRATVTGFASDTDTDTAGPFFGGIAGDQICTPSGVIGLPPLAPVNGGCTPSPTSGAFHTFRGFFTSTFANSAEGNVKTWAIMANAWYDIDMGSKLTPYFGGGIGYARTELRAAGVFRGDDGNFAWQLGAGINYAFNESTSLGLAYRYFDGGNVDISFPTLSGRGTSSYDVQDHSILLTLTLR